MDEITELGGSKAGNLIRPGMYKKKVDDVEVENERGGA